MARIIFVVFCAIVASPAFAQEKTRILFIGKDPDHPYGTHMYMHASNMLAKCVELTPGVEGVVSKGWPKDKATLQGVKSIVMYTNPAAEFLLDGADREEVENLLKKGVGLATIHWASSITKPNLERLGPLWLSYTGGTWVSNVGLSGGTSKLKQLLPKHPVSRGWKEFDIDDEYYMNPTLKGAEALLQVTEKGGKDVVVGWVYQRDGGGRSFGTTLGHYYRNFEMEPFRRMVVNGILWTAGVDVPETGAAVNVDASVLALPAKK